MRLRYAIQLVVIHPVLPALLLHVNLVIHLIQQPAHVITRRSMARLEWRAVLWDMFWQIGAASNPV